MKISRNKNKILNTAILTIAIIGFFVIFFLTFFEEDLMTRGVFMFGLAMDSLLIGLTIQEGESSRQIVKKFVKNFPGDISHKDHFYTVLKTTVLVIMKKRKIESISLDGKSFKELTEPTSKANLKRNNLVGKDASKIKEL